MADNAISSIDTKKAGLDHSLQSAIIVTVISLLALLLGWSLKNSMENRVQVKEHAGIRVEFPLGWKVETGLQDEEFVFSGRNQFDPTLSYTIYMMPVSNDMKVTDLVVTRNLERGQKLSNFRVLDQGAVVINGKDAYRVQYVYVQPGSNDQLPVVIEGMDYYFFTQPKSMVATLEEEPATFKDAQPRFESFLQKVSISGGK